MAEIQDVRSYITKKLFGKSCEKMASPFKCQEDEDEEDQ